MFERRKTARTSTDGFLAKSSSHIVLLDDCASSIFRVLFRTLLFADLCRFLGLFQFFSFTKSLYCSKQFFI